MGVVGNVQVTAGVLQFLSFHCGGVCDCTGNSCCVAVSVISSGSGVEVHVNVQMTAVVLQFLSVPEGAGVQEPGASPAGGCAWNLPPRAQLPEAAPTLFRHHG